MMDEEVTMMTYFRRWMDSLGRWPLPLVLGLIAAAAAVALSQGSAFARAGGGQHYVGGGGGGFSGGGDGGDGVGALLYLVVLYPEIGVPVLIVVVVAAIVRHRINPDRTTARAVRRLERVAPPGKPDLSFIRERDPGFDEGRFVERVKETESRVQEAWGRGDMDDVRPLLSDGLFRRFTTQLRLVKRQGIQNVMADHRILDARIYDARSDAHFDTLHVLINATARDAEVDAALSHPEALAAARRRPEQGYTEVWSFLRKPGAVTLDSGGALEGRCPNCGGAVESGESTRCGHCEALVNSGEYDWVLAEITQLEEWRPGGEKRIRGIDRMTAKNPGFNRQASEDRASYLFWRWIEALVTGDPGPLAKVAARPLKDAVSEMVQAGPSNLYKVAVGAADLIACETDVMGRDRFHVRVLWSSARAAHGAPAHQANILSVGRKSGVVLESDAGFSYARCPVCHAPLRENDTARCDYCGERLDAGDKDWVLEAIVQPDELVLGPEESASKGPDPAFIPDMGSQKERTALLMRMAAVVVADGKVTADETKLLKRAAKRWQVPFAQVVPVLLGEVPAEVGLAMQPKNPEAFFAGLVSAALVDGRIDKKEERLLLGIGQNLNLDADRARRMMQESAALMGARTDLISGTRQIK
jgi:hypothetical protein